MIRSIRLNLDVDRIGDRINEVMELAVRKIAMQILTGVVYRTPVDTGRARSNWNVSVEGPNVSVRLAHAPGEKLGLDEQANAQATITANTATIEGAPAFGVIFISNGLPYINRLEHGHSQAQAPQGMVRLTLDQVAAQFE